MGIHKDNLDQVFNPEFDQEERDEILVDGIRSLSRTVDDNLYAGEAVFFKLEDRVNSLASEQTATENTVQELGDEVIELRKSGEMLWKDNERLHDMLDRIVEAFEKSVPVESDVTEDCTAV